MKKPKLIRVTTIPSSLGGLLKNQLKHMSNFYEVIGVSSPSERLEEVGRNENIRTYGIEMTRAVTPLQDLKSLIKFIKFLKQEKPHIVHTHTPKAGFIGILAAWIMRVPLRLHTVAGMPLMESTGMKKRILLFIEKVTYMCATKVYPNSYGLEEYILENNLAPRSKVKVIGKGSSNGIDLNHFDPDALSIENVKLEFPNLSKFIGTNDFNFIYVGRLVKDKGINELSDAFARVAEKIDNVNLIVLGHFDDNLDPITPRAKEIIQTHPKIHYMGWQKNILPFLKVSNVLILPSYREGLPNVLMQAGAFYLPVITTKIIGCTDVVKDKENGLLVAPKSAEDLYQAMMKIYSDRQLYNDMKVKTRNMIADRYDRNYVWSEIRQEYQNLLSNV